VNRERSEALGELGAFSREVIGRPTDNLHNMLQETAEFPNKTNSAVSPVFFVISIASLKTAGSPDNKKDSCSHDRLNIPVIVIPNKMRDPSQLA
jgi:hypothetical protein